jgi:hypothetical protein
MRIYHTPVEGVVAVPTDPVVVGRPLVPGVVGGLVDPCVVVPVGADVDPTIRRIRKIP